MKRLLKFISISFLTFIILVPLIFLVVDYLQEPLVLNDEERAKIGGSFIKLKKGYTYFEDKGSDSLKTVIFIHGAGSGSYAWNKNFDSIHKGGFRTIRYDLYGRGFSDRPFETYELSSFTNQLTELIDSLKCKKPLYIIALSMGAMVAIDYSLKHADKVEKLIFVDPAAIFYGKPPFYVTSPIISDVLFTFYWRPNAIQKQMNEFYDPNKVSEYRDLSEKQMQYQGFKRAVKKTWSNTMSRSMETQLIQLGEENIDKVLIFGENDPLVPPAMAEKYATFLKTNETHIIKKAGHLSCYEQPILVNKIILTSLRR